MREKKSSATRGVPVAASVSVPAEPPRVTVHDVVSSQVIVGQGNVALQLTLDGHAGYSDRTASAPLTPRPLAVIGARRSAPEPVGRAAVVEQATAALLDGRSVQLCGTRGTGKTAVAEAVARRLAEDSRTGVLLAGGRPRTELLPLYTELARVFFSVDWYEPDEAVLRAETGRHRPDGTIMIPDCELTAEDAERLLGTFPDCVFLLCSPQQSLYTGEIVLDIEPLSLDATRALVERELGRPLAGFENLQVQHIHEVGEGRISRVLVCAAFLRRVAADARQYGVVPLSPQDQIAVLLQGISEPARRALAALCAFGPAPEDLLGLLAGGLPDPVRAAVEELEHAGLATWAGDLFQATDDARDAMSRQGWSADPRPAADELIRVLARARQEPGQEPDTTTPQHPAFAIDARLCVALARNLLDGGDADRASALSRVAAPAALAGGDLGAWKDLVTIGLRAARAGSRGDDLVYFLTEEHTRALLTGDRIAAAAALTAVGAALVHGGVLPVGPGAHHTPAPKPRTPLRHALQERFGRGVATAVMIGAPLAAAGAVTATAVGAAAVARPSPAPAHTVASAPTSAATSAAAASNAAAGAAAVYPYGIGDSPTVRDGGGNAPYELDTDYPTVTGLADKALEQKINAALSSPSQKAISGFPVGDAGTQPGQTAPDPGTMTMSSEVFQAGRLISIYYLDYFHYAGAGDTNYVVQSVTVRTDTGDVISPSDILTPAATTTGLATLAAELQAQPTVNGCDGDSQGREGLSTLTSALQQSTPTQPAFAVTVTPSGLIFFFTDGAISGTACRPTAFLTWQQLPGMVNPQVLSLTQQSPTVGVGTAPTQFAIPSPTGPPPATTPATPSSATTTATHATTPSSASPTDPASVVKAYYAAVDSGDFAKAWALGGKNLGSSYAAFSSGYGQTKSAVISIDSVSGDTVEVTLHSTQTDGAQATYEGTYTVDSGVITGADLHRG